MYSIQRIHINDATTQELWVFQIPSHSKVIAIYDDKHASCQHYTGCHPGECATASCMRVVTRTEEIIQNAGFRL